MMSKKDVSESSQEFKTNYFNHDFSASNDPKIIRMESICGLEGYAVYFKLIEMLHSNKGVIINDLQSLAYTFRCDKKLINTVVNDFDLFVVDDTEISSNRVKEQLQRIVKKSSIGKANAEKRWNKVSDNKSKIDKGVQENTISEEIPTEEDFMLYLKNDYLKGNENRYQKVREFMIDKYNSWLLNDWKDGNDNPIKKWRAKAVRQLTYAEKR
jgi:uncharacterized protein YdaU (DUF1376 family)